MFGSIVAEEVIYQRLSSDPTITGTVGESVWALMSVPQGEPIPALLFYRTNSSYGGYASAVESDDINYEEMLYEVHVVCEGTSTVPIEDAAERQMDLLSGFEAQVQYRGRNYQLLFTAEGETMLGSVQEGPQFYRDLGTVYRVEISRGE